MGEDLDDPKGGGGGGDAPHGGGGGGDAPHGSGLNVGALGAEEFEQTRS